MYHYRCFIFIFYDYFIECLFQASDFENENYLRVFEPIYQGG